MASPMRGSLDSIAKSQSMLRVFLGFMG
ncbi:hypothetical protein SCA6_003224 [Theobroma cacao]